MRSLNNFSRYSKLDPLGTVTYTISGDIRIVPERFGTLSPGELTPCRASIYGGRSGGMVIAREFVEDFFRNWPRS